MNTPDMSIQVHIKVNAYEVEELLQTMAAAGLYHPVTVDEVQVPEPDPDPALSDDARRLIDAGAKTAEVLVDVEDLDKLRDRVIDTGERVPLMDGRTGLTVH